MEVIPESWLALLLLNLLVNPEDVETTNAGGGRFFVSFLEAIVL